MDRSYFERLHAEEARRTGWRMLDEALQTRPERSRRLRRSVGRVLIALGARLTGEPNDPAPLVTPQPCDL